MERAVEHLVSQNAAALWLDPGMRKTSITLAAFCQLKEQGIADKMLVIAPLRVCRLVWRQEGAKWSQFKDLKFSLLHGPKKAERLKDDADIYLINFEGVQWLADQFYGRPMPFDTVTIDEITKVKNHRSKRSKALRPRLKGVKRRWGLTGTPSPNGYLDLFGQFLMLDDGAALGKYITHYREKYFVPDYNGFDYVLQPTADKRIEARVKPYVFRLKAEDYIDLPQLVDDPRMIELDTKSRRTYESMRKDKLAELEEGTVTGANAGAVYSKLSQMANGAVYITNEFDTKRTVAPVHDAKIDALEELIEELDGKQLLIAYEFEHDLAQMKKRFPKLPHLGKGVSEAKEQELVEKWNKGELITLAAHPASVGHGLNLQEGSAAHLCWFSLSWDLELYDQFVRRLLRSGNEAQHIFNHLLLVQGTIDELKLAALRDKDVSQSRLLTNLASVLQGEAITTDKPQKQENTMVVKLGKKSDDGKIVPKGWGKPAAEEVEETEEVEEAETEEVEEMTQQERIREKITRKAAADVPEDDPEEEPPASEKARSMFTKDVQDQLESEDDEPEPEVKEEKPKMTAKRTRNPKKETAPEPTPTAPPPTAQNLASASVAEPYIPPAFDGHMSFHLNINEAINKHGAETTTEVMVEIVRMLDSLK